MNDEQFTAVAATLAVGFLDWVSDKGYMRLSKEAGHKWFKIGVAETYTTRELYLLFLTPSSEAITK